MKAVWLALFGTVCFLSDGGKRTHPECRPRTEIYADCTLISSRTGRNQRVPPRSQPLRIRRLDSSLSPLLFILSFLWFFFLFFGGGKLKNTRGDIQGLVFRVGIGPSRWRVSVSLAVRGGFVRQPSHLDISDSLRSSSKTLQPLWNSKGHLNLRATAVKCCSLKKKTFSFGFGSVTWSRMNAGGKCTIFYLWIYIIYISMWKKTT